MSAGQAGGSAWRVVNTVTGSLVIGTVIQGQTIHVTLPEQITPATGGLPRAAGVFTGRDEHLNALLAGLDPRGMGGAVLVSAVAGMAGVGKTELVLQTAHRAREAGWFPGGMLFIDLFGYDPDLRLAATDALGSWLEALGVPGEHIPAHEQDRARLWRTVLDAYSTAGRRVLLIIDNAADTTQVTPLLPADAAVPVLVTSRHTLNLDARLHTLPVLDPEPAAALIADVIRLRCGPDDARAQDPVHQPGLAELATLCGGLPLALRIIAALLVDRPHRTPDEFAASLRDEHSRLHQMRRTETDGEIAVHAAFDLSYRHLTPAQARLFRLLPVNPGPTIATPAAAHLTDLTDLDTEILLQDLHRAHLVEEPAPGRWRQHDLLRLHATSQTPDIPDEADTARRRLLTHYLTTTDAADKHLRHLPGQPAPTRFTGHTDALAWLDAEHLNLIAVTTHAAANGDHHTTAHLPALLSEYLSWRRHLTDWVTLATLAHTATQALHDRHDEGRALNNLGLALRQVRRFGEAITAFQQAASIYLEAGDRPGEGRALNNLGIALREVRRFDDAIDVHQQAADTFRDAGDRHREGAALNNLGIALQEVRRFGDAIDAHQQAADSFRHAGDRHREGTALNNLGIALQKVRRFDEAITAVQQSVSIYRETGDRHGEGRALGNLGIVLQEVGRFDEAIAAHQGDLAICREAGDRHGEGTALNNLGIALREVRGFDEARRCWADAVRAFTEAGDARSASSVQNFLTGLDDEG